MLHIVWKCFKEQEYTIISCYRCQNYAIRFQEEAIVVVDLQWGFSAGNSLFLIGIACLYAQEENEMAWGP